MKMEKIKCPACWNEIDQDANKCPFCGFVLRESVAETHSTYTPIPADNVPKEIYPAMTQPAGDYTNANQKAGKDKKIIIAAIVAVCLILVIGIGKGTSKSQKRESSNYAYGTGSGYTSGYSSTSTVTTGNEGALNKAKSYLDSSAFSYTGLIEQLEYEGFSESEATYGADYCGADWKEQALRKAKSYLNSSAFSESGLQEQLEYEGFTYDQASYGASQNGL